MHSSPGIQKSPTKKLQVLSPQGVDENKPQENEEMKDEDEKMDTSNEMKEDVVMSSLGAVCWYNLLTSLCRKDIVFAPVFGFCLFVSC